MSRDNIQVDRLARSEYFEGDHRQPPCLAVARKAFAISVLVGMLASSGMGQQGKSAQAPGPTSDEPKQADGGDPAANKDNQSGRRGSFVAVPVPTSSPALGSGATVFGGYIFRLRAEDAVSRPSTLGGAAVFTDNGSRAFVVGADLYFSRDRYHILTGIARGDLNYQFYGTGDVAGDAGISFQVNQQATVFFGEMLRRIGWDIFIGPRVWIGSSSLQPEDRVQSHPELPQTGVDLAMRSLGFKVERDTTPNRFYPTSGTMAQFNADFFAKALGGTFTFQTYRVKFNAYRSFGSKQVLAYNAYLCGTGGNAPYFGKCIFGIQNELRGYPAGRYIDRMMLATQIEYRRTLWWRFGVVVFAGVGEVAPAVSKFNADNLLGSAGGGIRLTLSRKYHVNVRADIARGKNGHTFSMGLGEAF